MLRVTELRNLFVPVRKTATNTILSGLFLLVIILEAPYVYSHPTAADTVPPTISIVAQPTTVTVSGASVTILATATDNLGVVGVQFRLDGVNLGSEDLAAPYAAFWNTLAAANGLHTLTAVARDAAGNKTTSAPITVTKTTLDTTAPAVSISAPLSGTTVANTDIVVSATATDNMGVVGVQFRLDGVNLGSEDLTAPYSVVWNTVAAATGPHTLTAVARDAAGNKTTSAPITVTKTTPDTTAPTVSMTAPSPGTTVSGSAVMTSATATDNIGIVGVQFRLDGVNLGSEDLTAPYAILWNTVGAANGPHTLTAVARDAAGNKTTSAQITVTKTTPDTTAPAVSITAPLSGATIVSGDVGVSATATDNVGVVGVQFWLDGATLGSEDLTAPYAGVWSTAAAAKGSHTLTAVARDAAGNRTAAAPITVTIRDTTPPTVSMTAPSSGATVSGSAVTISATAMDNIAVVGVQFRLDGVNLGTEDTVAPYSMIWNPMAVPNGSHTLKAVARDAAGNKTTSASVTLTKTATVPSMAAPSLGAMGSSSLQYLRVKPNAAVAPPFGVVTLAYRDAGILVSETTLPSSARVQSGRIYVDLTSSIKTGIALANSNDQAATIVFYFANAGGTQIRSGSLTLPAHQQVAEFLDAGPFSAPLPMQGTFTFTSSVPVSAGAVRGFTNERGDFVMANVPVVPLGQPGSPVLMFPRFVGPGNGQDSVILVNSTDKTLSGSVQFFGQPSKTGNTLPVGVGGAPGSTISYVVPPQGEVTIRLQGTSDAANVGSARITPSSGTAVPQGFSLFSYKNHQGVTTSETMLPSVIPGQAFRMYVESAKVLSAVDSLRTALVLFNPSTAGVTALLELRDLSGTLIGPVQAINLPAGGQLSGFVNTFLPQMPEDLQGVLRVTASSPLIVGGLRGILNGRNEILLTAMPAWNESTLPAGSESNFAYVLNGGGYSSKFTVLSPTLASGEAGTLWLVNQDGSITDKIQSTP